MLKVDIKDKIVYVCDDQFTKAKINSIKTIIKKYGIKDILDFKFTFIKDLFGISQQSAEVILNKSISIDEFYNILNDMFEEIEKENSDDFESISISIEGLFIL